jgi:hypothetical protein
MAWRGRETNRQVRKIDGQTHKGQRGGKKFRQAGRETEGMSERTSLKGV